MAALDDVVPVVTVPFCADTLEYTAASTTHTYNTVMILTGLGLATHKKSLASGGVYVPSPIAQT